MACRLLTIGIMKSVVLCLSFALFIVGACGGTARRGDGGDNGADSAGSTHVGGSKPVAGAASVGGSTSVGGSGGDVDPRACTSNGQCQLVPSSCCSCGSGGASDYMAINSRYAADAVLGCAEQVCGPCSPPVPDLDAAERYLLATCSAGRCTVVDLKATVITECASDDDCALRAGLGCCQECGVVEPVAIARTEQATIGMLVCAGPMACDPCVATLDGYAATCKDDHCSVSLAP